VAAAPLVILVLWGFRAELGFLVGTIAAAVFILFVSTGALGRAPGGRVESALLVLAAQVSAVQFSGLVGPASAWPRSWKVIVLAAVVVIGLVWAAISAVLSRGPRED